MTVLEKLRLGWQALSLWERVETMDIRLIVQVAVAALSSGLAAIGAAYAAGQPDWKAMAGAFFGAAVTGAIQFVRQSPVVK